MHHLNIHLNPRTPSYSHIQLAAVSLLLSSGANPDTADSHGNTALHAAVDAESAEDGAAIAAALIDAGCNRNHRNELGMTPLHIAAERGNTLAAELLVAMGCQVCTIFRSSMCVCVCVCVCVCTV